jgi:beta-lactamase class A
MACAYLAIPFIAPPSAIAPPSCPPPRRGEGPLFSEIAPRSVVDWWCGVLPSVRAAEVTSKEAVLWERLRVRFENVERSLDGVLGVAVKDLEKGMTIEIRPREVFPTASLIKVAVLYELYRQAEEGRIDLAEVTQPRVPRVRGGGVLQDLGDRVSLTLRDLAVLMIGWSDNEATNLLIGRVEMDAVNRRLEGMGLGSTRLRRHMMDLAAARRGDENLGTPADFTRLMEQIHRGTGLSPSRAQDLLAVLSTEKRSTVHVPPSPFRAPLPEGLTLADKAGELDGVRAVAALVLVPGRPYVVTIMTAYLKREAEGEAAIGDLSAALYETFDRLARTSEHGRIIEDR